MTIPKEVLEAMRTIGAWAARRPTEDCPWLATYCDELIFNAEYTIAPKDAAPMAIVLLEYAYRTNKLEVPR